jgi:hypothetical protein
MKDLLSLVKDTPRGIIKTNLRSLGKAKQAWDSRIKTLPDNSHIHPILFSIYPILFFYSYNITELPPSVLLFPISVSVFMTVFLWGIFYFYFKNIYKASLVTSILIILFYSFTPLYQLFTNRFQIGVTAYQALVFCLVLLVLVAALLKRTTKKLKIFTQLFNSVSLVLFIYASINIASYEIGIRNQLNLRNISQENPITQENQERFKNRDIYYIILDAYGRQDILNNNYNYDNTTFIQYLENTGFFVASESNSNYAYTQLSLPSTFNFKYLNYLTDQFGKERRTMDPVLAKMLHENEVGQFLKSRGYRFINFGSGWLTTENISTADVNIRQAKFFSLFGKTLSINDFYSVLLNTTALSPFIQETLTDKARERILYNFAELAEIPYQRGNKFILAHFILPHPPYLFDEDGGPVPDNSPSGYDKELDIKQLQFANKMVQTTIDKILARSNPKPIIIIASDHGPLIPDLSDWPDTPSKELVKKRMSILNAYYFPEGGSDLLYNSITPVNTFRILFNYYFGTKYELLEDKSYFSWANAYYEFYDVTNQIKSSE